MREEGVRAPEKPRGRPDKLFVVVGSPTLSPPRMTARERAWTAMRIHRSFTAPQIASSADVTRGTVMQLARHLVRCRILVRAGRQQPSGTPGCFLVYRVARDIGPSLPSEIELIAQAKTQRKAKRR